VSFKNLDPVHAVYLPDVTLYGMKRLPGGRMTPRFIERHQDYVLKIASLPAGQIMTAMPVVLDLDAPFVLRSRAFRVVPNQNNVQVGLQYLKTSSRGRMRTTSANSVCQRLSIRTASASRGVPPRYFRNGSTRPVASSMWTWRTPGRARLRICGCISGG